MRNFLLVLTVLCLFLAGCASNVSERSEKITLTFWTLQLLNFKDTIQPMIDAYEKAHPGVEINWVDVPFSEGEKRTLTALMSHQTPDVVNLNPDFSAILANRNALLDMNEAVPAEVKSSYLPVAWEAATLNRADGSRIAFGLPWYITSSVTLYNRQLLEKAGYPDPPATYDELIPFARQVRDKTGQYAFMPVIAERGNFLKELKKAGVPLYDESGKAVFATPEAIALLEKYVYLYKNGLVPAEAITESHQAATDRYKGGTLGMLLVGPNFLNIVQENAPEVYKATAVAPQFPQNSRVKDFSLMVLVVPRNSAHPEQAADFAAFITNAANQMALAQVAPVLPSVTEALKDSYFNPVRSGDVMARGRGISARQLLSATETFQIRPQQNAINELVNYYVQMALIGKMDAADALRKAQEEVNDLFASGS